MTVKIIELTRKGLPLVAFFITFEYANRPISTNVWHTYFGYFLCSVLLYHQTTFIFNLGRLHYYCVCYPCDIQKDRHYLLQKKEKETRTRLGCVLNTTTFIYDITIIYF